MFYDCATKSELDKLQKIQNRALRVANLSLRYTRNIDLQRKFKVVPLFMRRDKNIQKMIHTYFLHNIDDIEFPWSNGDDVNPIIGSSIITM